ncbi:MAG: SNF2 helicase associated domain-containing protein, partial [Myxococcales bacterium]|nr:SNF2 helicase associated domain-containing protein [Myxococcales bacterium]
MASPFSEALTTLNDRALRRLLGARAYLRGYDYVRRHAVEDIVIEEASARGQVRGNDAEPYRVTLELTPSGFNSSCTCPAFASSNGGHCKHVAALLIALRDQARGAQQRAAQPSSNGVHYTVHGGTVHVAGVEGEGRRSKRARARAMKAAQHAAMTSRGFTAGAGSGVDAWLPEAMPPAPKQIEYRLQVKQVGHGAAGLGGGLTITLLDPEGRVPLLPSTLLVAQDQHPTPDREAIRLLARFENQGPRRVGIDVRGEDASDLLPLLKGRRVIVEPQMMELRFGDEPLRPRFDLELSPDGAQILVRTSFQRHGDPRRFTLGSGAWFEGSPGYYVDAQEGWARPIDRRVSPAAIRRLLRMPAIAEPVEKLPELIMQGLPRVALEVGAELPELSQVADVVDLTPTFRVAAGGTLTEAQVSLRAAYEDDEIDVRADGMTVPVIVKPPPPGVTGKRARCIRCDIVAQQEAAAKLRELGLVPAEDGNKFIAIGDDAIRFWTEGIGTLPDDWDLYVPDDLVDVQLRNEALTANARVSSGVDWLSLRLNFESEGVAVTQEELARCLAEGRRYVRLADGTFARLDPQKVREVLQRQAEILATGGGNGGRLPLSQAGRIEDLLAQVGRSNVSGDA